MATATVIGRIAAGPYMARKCPICGVWVFTDAGPFGEGDPTKTVADWDHYEAEHQAEHEGDDGPVLGMPFFQHNEVGVEAIVLSTAFSDQSMTELWQFAIETGETTVGREAYVNGFKKWAKESML